MIRLHHIQRIEVWDWLEGVKSHQGAASVGVKHPHPVPGLQAFQNCQRKILINRSVSIVQIITISNLYI